MMQYTHIKKASFNKYHNMWNVAKTLILDLILTVRDGDMVTIISKNLNAVVDQAKCKQELSI